MNERFDKMAREGDALYQARTLGYYATMFRLMRHDDESGNPWPRDAIGAHLARRARLSSLEEVKPGNDD